MRIISKDHDYYDVVQKQGADKNVVYLRNFTKLGSKDTKDKEDFAKLVRPISEDLKVIYRTERGFHNFGTTSVGFVFFCNKVYPYIEFRITEWTGKYSSITERVICYNVSSVKKVIDKYKAGYYKESQTFDLKTMLKRVDLLFSNSGKELKGLIDLHFKHKCPIFLSVYNGYRDEVEANPILKEIEFFKVFDAYSAYQELSMFVGGILTGNATKTIEISDEMKAAKHGFDKYSFKTPPKGK